MSLDGGRVNEFLSRSEELLLHPERRGLVLQLARCSRNAKHTPCDHRDGCASVRG
jgi:hypothetical protein